MGLICQKKVLFQKIKGFANVGVAALSLVNGGISRAISLGIVLWVGSRKASIQAHHILSGKAEDITIEDISCWVHGMIIHATITAVSLSIL